MAGMRIVGESIRAATSTLRTPPPCGEGLGVAVVWRDLARLLRPPTPTLPHKGGGSAGALPFEHHDGIGKTAFAEANFCGRITWMSLSITWVLTGAAPWFWPLTNLVGP